MKKKSKKKGNFKFIFLLLFAYALIIVLGYFVTTWFIDNMNIRFTGDKTIATVYDKVVYREYDNESDEYKKSCEIFVEYKVKGRTYKDKLDFNTCIVREGSKLGIYYDVSDPSIFASKIMIGVSVLVILLPYFVFGFLTWKIILEIKESKEKR